VVPGVVLCPSELGVVVPGAPVVAGAVVVSWPGVVVAGSVMAAIISQIAVFGVTLLCG